MRQIYSVIICVVSCIIVMALLIVTIGWVSIISDKGAGSAAMGFLAYVSPAMLGVSLLFTGIPSGVLYFMHRQKRDLFSLVVSSATLLVTAVESIVLLKLPFHGS